MVMKKKDKANFYLKMNIGVKVAEDNFNTKFSIKITI